VTLSGIEDTLVTLLALDVGGSNTRARLLVRDHGRVRSHPAYPHDLRRRVRSKDALMAFLSELVQDLPENDKPKRCVAAFAGPIVNRDVVRMTNWDEPRQLDAGELVCTGVAEEVEVRNDMEAACIGLLARQNKAQADSDGGLLPLSRHAVTGLQRGPGNIVLVSPGTGLGAAAALYLGSHGGGAEAYAIVTTELQHTAIPALDDEHRRIIEWYLRRFGRAPTWEDFVSGRGLEAIYVARDEYQGGHEGREARGHPSAPRIARDACRGVNNQAYESLDLFYRCAGRFCQMLALAFFPRGGVYLAGNSTSENRDFISGSGFVAEFSRNDTQHELLTGFPVFLVAADLVLDGATALVTDPMPVVWASAACADSIIEMRDIEQRG
jgi:glucokinase